MRKLTEKIIPALFSLLFFATPIIFSPLTSEIFEFNKIIFVYFTTVLILFFWVLKAIIHKKFPFRRTILDIPLALFLLSQIISTIFSIDPTTSLLGYYSRFNGGLLSAISYSLLYWAYVSNMDYKKTLSALCYTLISATLVSLYGILEHFGIDKNIWVQDVVNRVFSTLGQPNWLAAYIVALIPLTWSNSITKQLQTSKFKILNYALSILFFTVLLFTKSRSGLLGFVVADIIFWAFILVKYKKQYLKKFLIFNLLFSILFLFIGKPFRVSGIQPQVSSSSPALETGGTESGQIRKIVWRGAIDIWKHYPLFGSGVETYAYSYFKFKPKEQNLVSEWDFIYNKAHNEYLNYLATTGIFGLVSYLVLIGFSLYLFIKNFQFSIAALCAGYASILVTNFFGFSVVVVSIITFLFPAIALCLQEGNRDEIHRQKPERLNTIQVTCIFLSAAAASFLLYLIIRIYTADIYYNKGKILNSAGQYQQARMLLYKAIKTSPITEPVYLEEISRSALGIAGNAYAENDSQNTKLFAETALYETAQAIKASPSNLNLYKTRAAALIKLAEIDANLLSSAAQTLETAWALAPTDAKVSYNLGLVYSSLKNYDRAVSTLEKTIEIKANYKEAREALSFLYLKQGEKEKARDQLRYILKYISPNDLSVQKQLDSIKK